MRLREIRERAEERAAAMEHEGGLSRTKADLEAIRWAKQEFGASLMIVIDAALELPHSGLSGRVLWPVIESTEVELSTDDRLPALEIAAMRCFNRLRSKIPEGLEGAFQQAALQRLAASEGISAVEVAEYLGLEAASA